jgi:hypothetical protein
MGFSGYLWAAYGAATLVRPQLAIRTICVDTKAIVSRTRTIYRTKRVWSARRPVQQRRDRGLIRSRRVA